MQTDTPIVTVVIPCFNMGDVIEETIRSVQQQLFKAYEIIIVDDGSNDSATISRLDELEAEGISVIRTSNCGVAAARNNGILEAQGKYILPLDADDLIDPHFLEKAVMLLDQNPDIGIVGCNAELFGEVSSVRRLPDFSFDRLLSENLIFSSALFRKSDWQRVGGYCTLFKYGWEDWDFWITMVQAGIRVSVLPEALLKYRIRVDSRDRSMSLWMKASMLLLIIVRHYKCYLQSPSSLNRLIVNTRLRNHGIDHAT